MHLRVRAGTGVDHFEKVLRGRVPAPAGHDRLDPAAGDRPTAADARVAGLVPHFAGRLQEVVAADPEVVKFCQFYQSRLDAALKAAGGDEYRRRKVEGDFRPYVQAEVLGLDGVQYDSGTIAVTFRADGVEYRQTLAAVPATAQLLAEPPTARCAVTGQTWPAACLADCAATGRPALRHRLTRTTAGKLALPEQVVTCSQTGDVILRTEATVSAVSGAVVRADRAVRCELTGDAILPAEAAESAVSGRLARRDRLVASAVSGRLGFPDEAVVCEASGRVVLRDEAVRSAVTGEWFAADRLEPSAASGGRVPPGTAAAGARRPDGGGDAGRAGGGPPGGGAGRRVGRLGGAFATPGG